MIPKSRTSIAKALRMSAPEIARIVRIVEIAAAEEDVRAAGVVVVVVGAAVAVEAVVVVMAVGMAVTAAAEGTKPRIAIYKSQNPHSVAQDATRVGTRRPGAATWSRLFSFGKNLRR